MLNWLRMSTALLAGLAPFAMTTAPALATDVCVRCQAPDATYRCRTELSGKYAALASNERLLNYACTKYISEKYKHSSCRAGGDVGQTCQGTKLTVDLSSVADQYAARIPDQLKPKPQQPAQVQSTEPAKATAPDKKDEPKTVIELAKQTAKASQKEIEGAGKAVKDAGNYVGDAAKKTWRCLSSLFQRC